ncbi:PIN domain-containing protein [Rhizobium fabae]|uniref:Type II toxin-antitoxin system VapC family toxin n=1 Tax=Rhizobium fabae TaxID=573179 RepID=A0A7W6B487_9HYPH|nr:PIN domain-containing protein [Rhizobium fabae]MBB3914591.1 hypothetical protein [Rhizobium fabae]RUM14499.1 type II toxin-antitoxin system VapC family toxin [Rhizobium fabae]
MSCHTFLVDTNILSDSQKRRPNPRLAHWLSQQDQIAIPYPVIVEIEQGIHSLRQRNPVRAQLLRSWVDGLLETEFLYPAMNSQVARLQAAMYSCRALKQLWFVGPESDKRPGNDLTIAAIAIAHHLPIATIDIWDFEKISTFFPLPGVYNPVSNAWIIRPAAQHQQSLDSASSSPMSNGRVQAS